MAYPAMDPDVLLQSPTRNSMQSMDWSLESPMATPERPSATHRDRYIPDRDSQSVELSRFYLQQRQSSSTAELASPINTPQAIVTPPAALLASTPVDEPYSSAVTRSIFTGTRQTTVLGLHDNRPEPQALSPSSPLGSPSGAENVCPATATSTFASVAKDLGPLLADEADEQPSDTQSEVDRFSHSTGVIYADNRARHFKSPNFRIIPHTPERILDAPELLDDFYLNLIDWSTQNVLSVALAQTLYLWNADNGEIHQLMAAEDRDNIITAVSWHQDGDLLAVGMHDADVQIWDASTQRLVHTFKGHSARVGALSWHGNILASGSRDATVRLHDQRAQSTISLHRGHVQEVCGLKWSPDGSRLASGGNDNVVCLWEFNKQSNTCRPMYQLRHHTAAVKALAWSPTQPHLLATGGGTADKTLKFFDTNTGTLLHSVDTKSQVCGALWSKNGDEIITSHGYSDNQLTIWKFPSMKRVTDLTGHSSRVLHLAMSPDGNMVVSAAADETIRFWRCFSSSTTDNRDQNAVVRRSTASGRGTSLSFDDDLGDFLR